MWRTWRRLGLMVVTVFGLIASPLLWLGISSAEARSLAEAAKKSVESLQRGKKIESSSSSSRRSGSSTVEAPSAVRTPRHAPASSLKEPSPALSPGRRGLAAPATSAGRRSSEALSVTPPSPHRAVRKPAEPPVGRHRPDALRNGRAPAVTPPAMRTPRQGPTSSESSATLSPGRRGLAAPETSAGRQSSTGSSIKPPVFKQPTFKAPSAPPRAVPFNDRRR